MAIKITRYNQVFHDSNGYAKAIRQGIAEHYQMEPGSFHGKLAQVVSHPVIISTHSLNRITIQTGYSLKGYTVFLLPGDVSQHFSWRKQRLTGKRIGFLKGEMPHYSVLPSNFFGTPISLNNEFFKELIIKLKLNDNLYSLIQQSEVVELDAEDAYNIQQTVISLCNSEKPDSKILINDLPEILLKSIEKYADKYPIDISGSRDLLLHQALVYIESHLDQKISTKKICNHLGISERTLRYLFNDLTGLTPIKFIKYLRLNKIRKEILKSTPKIKIKAIAEEWGFSHSGQFATDYRKLFGEFPSETVKARR